MYLVDSMSSGVQQYQANDTISYPPSQLTDEQREFLIDYLDLRESTRMNRYDPIWLVLLLAKKRPGIVLMTLRTSSTPPDESPPITKEEVAETFGLHYIESDDYSLSVSRTEWRLDILPTEQHDVPGHHRRLGCFLGYPLPDIAAFIRGDHTEPLSIQESANGYMSPQETAYTAFSPHLHKDSDEGRKRAIQIGKENYNTVLEYADLWNLPQLRQYTEQLFQEAVADQSGFA